MAVLVLGLCWAPLCSDNGLHEKSSAVLCLMLTCKMSERLHVSGK